MTEYKYFGVTINFDTTVLGDFLEIISPENGVCPLMHMSHSITVLLN